MATSNLSGSGAPFSVDGPPDAQRFQSILFERAEDGVRVDGLSEPDFFADLNLDQVLKSMTTGREQYELRPFFYAPLHEVSAVRYRQAVLRDLQKPDVRESIARFTESMRHVRAHVAQIEELRHPLQKQAWFLDAVEIYCQAVAGLEQDLAERNLDSRGFRGLRVYVAEYVGSERFSSLAAATQALKDADAQVRYAVRINGTRVTVTNFDGEPDYGAEVAATFAKFQQGAVKSYLVKLPNLAAMDHVEAQILDCVARLNSELFARRAGYCASQRDYLDPTIATFDREVQFYLAYLELIERLGATGLPFCYPQVSDRSKTIAARETFDIALANKLVPDGDTVVCNDFHLEDAERMFVVSGPNNGGKTTFARTFGQVHYLASLGLLVPGTEARLFLPDRIYTHFEKEEDIETLRGKFDDELLRVHEILEHATSNSVIVMNESFNSTTLNDALVVGTEVMQQIIELGPLGVYVTFVEEIASLSEATVSMVSQIVPENPAERTFKILRRPADGLAYAWAIAEKYGLTHERLVERLGA